MHTDAAHSKNLSPTQQQEQSPHPSAHRAHTPWPRSTGTPHALPVCATETLEVCNWCCIVACVDCLCESELCIQIYELELCMVKWDSSYAFQNSESELRSSRQQSSEPKVFYQFFSRLERFVPTRRASQLKLDDVWVTKCNVNSNANDSHSNIDGNKFK